MTSPDRNLCPAEDTPEPNQTGLWTQPRRWQEPATRLTLRWGAYRPRLIAGIALIALGTACVLGTTAYSLPLLLAGSLLQPAGWAVLPATIGRRMVVLLPTLGFTWLLLGGSHFSWCWTVLMAAWLLVRLRPLASFAVLLLPLASSLVLAQLVNTYEHGWATITISALVVIASSWLARGLAIAWDSWQSASPLRSQKDRLDRQRP